MTITEYNSLKTDFQAQNIQQKNLIYQSKKIVNLKISSQSKSTKSDIMKRPNLRIVELEGDESQL